MYFPCMLMTLNDHWKVELLEKSEDFISPYDGIEYHCAAPEKNLYPPHGRSLEIPGAGGSKKSNF